MDISSFEPALPDDIVLEALSIALRSMQVGLKGVPWPKYSPVRLLAYRTFARGLVDCADGILEGVADQEQVRDLDLDNIPVHIESSSGE